MAWIRARWRERIQGWGMAVNSVISPVWGAR